MRRIFGNRRLLVLIVIVVIVLVGVGFWKRGGLEKIIPSKVDGSKDSIFVHTAKQFSFKVPEGYSVTEPASGKQTFIYPTGKKIGSGSVEKIIGEDVIIVETAVNKKDSFDALIDEIKTKGEKNGNKINKDVKDFGKLKAVTLSVNGKIDYKQTYFNTPSIIILTYRLDHPQASVVEKSLSIDQTEYSERVGAATKLMRETRDNIASAEFSKLYQSSSDGLKKLKTEDEFGKLLKDVQEEFGGNVLIWGISLSPKGVGTAINVVDGDKVVRRGSFFYIKENDKYLLDGLRLSGKITEKEATSEE